VADFNIIIFTDTMIVQTGVASSTSIQVNSQNGFTGFVTLSTITPVGLTALLSNPVLELPPGSNVFSSLTVTASRNTPQGNYTITVTAFSNGLTRSGILHVMVRTPPPDFSISAFPSSLAIPRGSSGTSTITLMALNGFNGAVTLSATASPSGPALTLGPANVLLFNASVSTLTIIATNATFAGSYVITVAATSSTVSHTMSIILVVTQPPQPDFTLSTFASSLAVPAGTNAGTSVTLSSINGFAGTVMLTVSVFPTGFNGEPIPFLSPSSVVLTASGTASSSLTISTFSTTPQQSWTVTVSGTSGAVSHFTSLTLLVLAPPDIPPTARFSFTPTNPVAGQTVTFDGSASFDPDGSVQSWTWSFGDGFLGFSSITFHTYANSGNYTVTLTVRDNAGLFSSASMSVPVLPKPPHDVSVNRINVSPTVAVSTQSVYIQVQLENNGSSNETVSLTGYYNGHVIQTLSGIFIQSCSNNFNFCYPYSYNSILWDTTGVPAGNYTISATVSLSTGEVDPTPTDNTAVGGTVAILPAPVVTLTPVAGPVGTKVLVQGSGFPVPQPFQFGPVGYVIVTFDDMSTGFTFSHNGTFSFTFDVPQAQTGPHQVKALDEYTLARGAATFTVTATPSGNLAIVIDTGTIYFPGDTATVYVLTTFNGAAIGPSGLQLQLILFRPDGTNTTLRTASFSTGLYRATYTISSTGQLGTYTILAKARQTGPFDASTLRSFEVKPTWLSQNGRAVIGATSLAGIIGLAAVAWKRGYLQRKKGDEFSFSF
jgi:PKD repeat protein